MLELEEFCLLVFYLTKSFVLFFPRKKDAMLIYFACLLASIETIYLLCNSFNLSQYGYLKKSVMLKCNSG